MCWSEGFRDFCRSVKQPTFVQAVSLNTLGEHVEIPLLLDTSHWGNCCHRDQIRPNRNVVINIIGRSAFSPFCPERTTPHGDQLTTRLLYEDPSYLLLSIVKLIEVIFFVQL